MVSEFAGNVGNVKEALRALFAPTACQKNAYLSAKYGAEIYLKREDLSPVRSYKIRGAFNAMRKAIDTGRYPEFVCASAGNHAQGVAFACAYFKARGRIYMPVTTPSQKINKTAQFGGANVEIVLEGDYFDETLKAAERYAESQNAMMVPPFDNIDVIEGQATIGSELDDQLEGEPDMVIVPVGGGGLASGLLRYYEGREINWRFCEPKGARSLYEALKAKRRIELHQVNSFVDGAAVARIGEENYKTLRTLKPKDVLGIEEGRLCATIQELLNIEGIVLEPAGALAIDALKDLSGEIAGKRVVCIVSGGNFDFARLPDVKERALRYEGLKKYFILRMPQRPGALKDFLNMLGPDDDIARFEYLKKSARNFGSVLIGIETDNSKSFEGLFERMEEAGFTYQDITDDDVLSEFLI